MTIRSDEVEGPAYLASALVNGDTSGLDDKGKEELEEFLKSLDNGKVVSTEGEEYVGRYKGLLCTMIVYVVHRYEYD